MSKKNFLALLMLAATPQAFSQTTTYEFQNGLLLQTGSIYQGTDDNEFSSADLLNFTGERGSNPSISVDGSDGGNVTQGAIRFNNLLQSQGGAVPDAVTTGQLVIANARLEYWKTSGTTADAEIAFHQVVGVDNFTNQYWTEDDSWGGTVNDLSDVGPNSTFIEWPFGPAIGPQFTPEGFELEGFNFPPTGETATEVINTTTGLQQIYFESNDALTVNIPTFGGGLQAFDIATVEDTVTDQDSENIIGVLQDSIQANEISFVDAFNASFFSLNVTDTVQDWLVNGAPNQGWSISNNTTDGWDIASSEAEGQVLNQDDDGVFGGAVDLTGDNLALLNSLVAGDGLPAGLQQLEDSAGNIVPDRIALDGEGLRPKLIIEIAGPGGPADFNLSGETDLLDYALFLDAFGGQIDAQLSRGSLGDLDFDADVDTNDFLLFKNFFAEAQGMSLSQALQAVPEPSTGIIALLMVSAVAGRVRRQSV